MKLRFVHINEDEVEYDTSEGFDEAVAMLARFPNDSVRITMESPVKDVQSATIAALALDAAEGAFWRAVSDRYPEAKTGDVTPAVLTGFQDAAAVAIASWVELNKPTMTVEIELEDGTSARWANVTDAQVTQIESLLGSPDTLKS